jgi:type IV secretory pathway VirB10-like protein
MAMANAEAIADREERLQEHSGGGRFNKRILWIFLAIMVIGSTAVVIGIHAAGTSQSSTPQKNADDPGAATRSKSEIEDLAAHGMHLRPAPSVDLSEPPKLVEQEPVQHQAPKTPSRYQQWVEEKYMKALESPEMVQAFHGGGALEIASAKTPQVDAAPAKSDPAVTVHPPASTYTVMAGSVIPAILISGVNSDLPGPILAQVSQSVFDSATGTYVLIPQGSRLIGAYQNASAYGQLRVQIAWQRLIFPNTSSMNLPQMPGTDQNGYAGFSDQVNNHYLATFGTAALMSLISAGQMVGQMTAFGGGGTYGAYGYYQPNQWAMAGEMAGSAASGQFGGLGQQLIGNGINRPPTIEIRPGYQFNVMVTQDLVFPSPYGK